MEMREFKKLSLEQQADLLQEKGSYIGKQRVDGTVAILYQLESFYVEVYYNKFRTEIDRIEVFEDVGRIDPYLEEQ